MGIILEFVLKSAGYKAAYLFRDTCRLPAMNTEIVRFAETFSPPPANVHSSITPETPYSHKPPVSFISYWPPLFSLFLAFFRDKWVPVTTAWPVLRLRIEKWPPIWRAAADI